MWLPDAGLAGATPEAGDRPGEGDGDGEGEGDAEEGEEWMPGMPLVVACCACPPSAACASASFPFLVSTWTTSDFGREKELVRDEAIMLSRRG